MTTPGREQRSGLPVRLAALLTWCSALGWFGCGLLPPSARPTALSRQQIVQVLRERADRVRTVSDTGISLSITTTVEDKSHRWPTFRGHIAFDAERPGLWLRAEKLGRQIFSLKALGSRFWLVLPDTGEVVTGGPAAYAKLPHLIRPDEVRSFFAGPEWLGVNWPTTRMLVEKRCYRFDAYLLGALYRRVLVDRKKLVVTTIEQYDVLGRVVTRVQMADHAPADGTLFPRLLIVERPLSGVKVKLRLRDPKFNKALSLQVFQPAELPGWTQIDLDREPLSAVEAFRAK